MVETVRVSFGCRDAAEFVAELKQRVGDYFISRGISDKANAAMIFKTVVVLTLTFGAYGLILSNRFTPWEMLGLAIVMGIGLAGTGFCVSHDALHGAYSSNPKINRIIGFTFDIMGANGYLWKITHNVIHHTYTNIPGIDEDLDVSPLIRLSPYSEWKWFHRFQHVFAFFAYSFSTLFWVFVKDYKYFLKRDLGPYRNKKHPKSELAVMLSGKVTHYGYTIVIPLIVLHVAWWQFAIGYLAMHLTAGLILGVVFQLAHVVEGTAYPELPADGEMTEPWVVHEMRTTSNFARKNRLVCWYVGGLNFQVEHHLFPRVCSIHYPAISDIVCEVAEKYGVPYNQHPTMLAAIASHYRMLKRLGREAAGPEAVAVGPQAVAA